MEFDIFDKDFEDKINRYVGEKIKYYKLRSIYMRLMCNICLMCNFN